MKFVKQTVAGYGKGNCLAACLASLLDLEINEIPEIPSEKYDRFLWLFYLNEWLLKKFGLYLIFFDNQNVGFNYDFFIPKDEVVIAFGKSRNYPGQNHAVLWCNKELYFDPTMFDEKGFNTKPVAFLILAKSFQYAEPKNE